ncbi:MAG: hypothetical protein AAFR56_09655 [Chloroflexota bacterium]
MPIESRPHYAFLVQQLIHLYNTGQLNRVQAIHVEPEYGYAAMIHYKNGARRYLNGANVDVNPSGAADIVLDKGFAKRFMAQMGIPTPPGRTFLMPHYHAAFLQAMAKHNLTDAATVDDLRVYVRDEIGYPCYLKPNDGARGRGVFRCEDANDVETALAYFIEQRVDLVLAEAAINLPGADEYRITVYDEAVFACYARQPFTVTGDGTHTVHELMLAKRAALTAAGQKASIDPADPRIAARLRKNNRSLDYIPPYEEVIQLQDIANISSGGIVTDYTTQMHPAWAAIGVDIAAKFGLVLCGIDIICTNITQPPGDYRIIEINAAPGLSGYAGASADTRNRVIHLYRTIFNTPP